MTPTETRGSAPRSRRPLLAAAGGASLLLAAGGMAWVQGGVGAEPVSTDVAGTCAILGTTAAMAVPMTVDDAVDPVAPGGQQTLTIDQAMGALPVEVTIDRVVVTTPIPGQIASTDTVTFEGGNMAGSYEVVDGTLVVTYTGPQSSSQLQFPRTIVSQTVSDAPEGDTIHWKVWSSLVADTNYGTATCTPDDPTIDLNTTAIAGGGDGTAPTTSTTTGGTGGGDGGGGGGSTPTTLPGPTTPTTTPGPGGGGDGGGTPTPGVSVCVEVSAPVPVPIPCPITVPPADGSSPLPVPAPGGGLPLPLPLPLPGDGLPLPLPLPDGGSSPLPVPLPAPGGGGLPLPLPLPGGGTPTPGLGLGLDLDLQLGVSL